MIIVTNRVPQPHAASTFGPLILVRPGHERDLGLIAHERVHVRQFWRTITFHWLFYWASKSYRYRAELEAYREQLLYSPGQSLRFAGYIAERYGLSVTVDQAFADLIEEQPHG